MSHNNPVTEGLVYEAEYYPYSSAMDYAGSKGLLNVAFLSSGGFSFYLKPEAGTSLSHSSIYLQIELWGLTEAV
ncbi:MAG: hypothetical protein RLP12_11810, partial [Ekhidna sp.]